MSQRTTAMLLATLVAASCWGALTTGATAAPAAGVTSEVPPAAATPLRDWMRAEVRAAADAHDLERLAAAFDALAAAAPEGFDGWRELAAGGAAQARAGDLRAARRQCLGCHMKFQRRYRDTHRSTAWPK